MIKIGEKRNLVYELKRGQYVAIEGQYLYRLTSEYIDVHGGYDAVLIETDEDGNEYDAEERFLTKFDLNGMVLYD